MEFQQEIEVIHEMLKEVGGIYNSILLRTVELESHLALNRKPLIVASLQSLSVQLSNMTESVRGFADFVRGLDAYH